MKVKRKGKDQSQGLAGTPTVARGRRTTKQIKGAVLPK